MILSSTVYEVILDTIRKDARGKSLNVEEFNSFSKIVNELLFAKYFKDFETTSDNSETLSAFKVLGESVAIGAGGIGALPASFYHIVGQPYYTATGGITRYLDLVSSLEHAKRQQDYLTQATLTHPTFRFGIATTTSAMTVYVSPTTGINPIYMDYIRTPNTPFLDYYMNDTTLEYTYMAAGATVAVPSGSTARDGTIGAANVVSATVNYEWDNEDLPLIISMFLQQLGIQLPDPTLYEGGTLSEQKIDAA